MVLSDEVCTMCLIKDQAIWRLTKELEETKHNERNEAYFTQAGKRTLFLSEPLLRYLGWTMESGILSHHQGPVVQTNPGLG